MLTLLAMTAAALCVLATYVTYLMFRVRRQTRTTKNMAEALDHVAVCIYLKDAQRRYTYANRAAAAQLRTEVGRLLGALQEDLDRSERSSFIKESDERVLKQGESVREEFVVDYAPDDQQAFLEFKHPLRDRTGHIVGLVGVSTDVTELHRLQRELEHAARTDELTGIFNRRALFEFAEQDFAAARRHGRALSMLIIDIDRFKHINDSYGHPVGDRVIRSVALQAKHAIREIDRLGRVGGEEFVAILPEADIAQAVDIAERVRTSVEPISLQSAVQLRPTVSIGVASLSPEDRAVEDLYQRADEALYRAKAEGRNRVVAQQRGTSFS